METNKPIVSTTITDEEVKTMNPDDVLQSYRLPSRFAQINRMVIRDLNDMRYNMSYDDWGHWFKYKRDEVKKWLRDPYNYQSELRHAVIYLYNVSSHFRRLILYFAALNDFDYVVSPYKIDTEMAKPATIKRNYIRVLNCMSAMDVKNQLEKILIVCLREDIFFGTLRETADSIIIQQLPTDYCAISVIEDNVFNVTFDFSYFDSRPQLLENYPDEFREKYAIYHGNGVAGGNSRMRWQELSAPNSFAVKANKDFPNYAMPPFAGILREIFDIEDYKQMKKDKEQIENYAMLVMQLGIDADGRWQMDFQKAKDFWQNLDAVLPSEIGSVLSPMPIEKISFERNHTGDSDAVAEAEQNLFTAAGVSSLLFNNAKASSNALLLSIKADQAITYSIVKSIECVINRFIHRHGYGKYFHVTFLDISCYNRKEASDAYLRACTYGLPMLFHYAAAQGMQQDDMDTMAFLESKVLNIRDKLQPLRSSATMTSAETAGVSEGRTQKDDDELSDSGEQTRERDEGND